MGHMFVNIMNEGGENLGHDLLTEFCLIILILGKVRKEPLYRLKIAPPSLQALLEY